MDSLIHVLETLVSGGLLAFILTLLQRKWAKSDKKEDREDKQKQATIEDIKKDIEKLFKKLDEVMETTSAVVDAQKAIMVERMRYLGTCYITEKKIYMDDKIHFKKMYAAYKQLPQANGDVDPVMEEVEKLPIKEKPA